MLAKLDKESMLVLYLADELSAGDRAEVERRLGSDPMLRTELERLENATQSFENAMAQLDAMPPASEAIVVRRIGLAMRKQLAEELAAEMGSGSTVTSRGLRYPVWAYPIAAAAAVLIVFVGWWGHRPDGSVRLPALGEPVVVAPMPDDEARKVATDMEKSFEDTNLTQSQKSVASLESAEYQLAELSRSRDGTAAFGFSDGQ